MEEPQDESKNDGKEQRKTNEISNEDGGNAKKTKES